MISSIFSAKMSTMSIPLTKKFLSSFFHTTCCPVFQSLHDFFYVNLDLILEYERISPGTLLDTSDISGPIAVSNAASSGEGLDDKFSDFLKSPLDFASESDWECVMYYAITFKAYVSSVNIYTR